MLIGVGAFGDNSHESVVQSQNSTAPVEDLGNFEQPNPTNLFMTGFNLAKRYAYEKEFRIRTSSTGVKVRGLSHGILPTEYQAIEMTPEKNDAWTKIGEILPEKEHLRKLKSSEEIANEIKRMIDQNSGQSGPKNSEGEISLNKESNTLVTGKFTGKYAEQIAGMIKSVDPAEPKTKLISTPKGALVLKCTTSELCTIKIDLSQKEDLRGPVFLGSKFGSLISFTPEISKKIYHEQLGERAGQFEKTQFGNYKTVIDLRPQGLNFRIQGTELGDNVTFSISLPQLTD